MAFRRRVAGARMSTRCVEARVNPIALAPTSLPNSPPLEYVDAAARAGYDGIGIRLYRSPGVQYAFYPVAGDAALMREVKRAIAGAGLTVYDILSFYLQPEMDLDSMRPALEFGAELGATYALVIGDDPDWGRMCDSLGRICDTAAGLGMTVALEAPVNARAVNTLPLALRLIADTGRENAVICLDPLQYFRAGHSAELLTGQDPRLFPYTQITDGLEAGGRCALGEGSVPLRAMLDRLPAELPLSLEWAAPAGSTYTAAEWARAALEHTRRYLDAYYAEKR
jgi:sugar phosphate isomerase/epimerase